MATSTKNATSDSNVRLVISSPHDGPTRLTLTASGVDARLFGQGERDGLGLGTQLLEVGLDPDATPLGAGDHLDLGVLLAGGEGGTHVGHRAGLVGDLPHTAALEVDAQVEAANGEGARC